MATTARIVYSRKSLEKALAAIADGKVTEDDVCLGVFRVTGTDGDPYRVTSGRTTDGKHWVSCTCPHGLHVEDVVDTRCYHAVAALLIVMRGEKKS